MQKINLFRHVIPTILAVLAMGSAINESFKKSGQSQQEDALPKLPKDDVTNLMNDITNIFQNRIAANQMKTHVFEGHDIPAETMKMLNEEYAESLSGVIGCLAKNKLIKANDSFTFDSTSMEFSSSPALAAKYANNILEEVMIIGGYDIQEAKAIASSLKTLTDDETTYWRTKTAPTTINLTR